MRFALDLTHHAWARDRGGQAAERSLQVARAADAAGIDIIWASEDPEAWDAFALLSAVATVTNHARLGSGVTNPYHRHPNTLAAAVATLDRLSGGRAILGIGRGQVEWHRDALGVETGEPLAALAETVDLLRTWWTPSHRASSPADGHFAVREWERVIHPTQSAVPIYLAAAGPRALELAGTIGDGVMFNLLTSEEGLREAIPRVRAAASAAGRDPDALAIVLRTNIAVATSPEVERKAIDRAKAILALVGPLPGMGRLLETSGFDVPTILEEAGEAMHTREALIEGKGFPTMQREGDLAAARAAIPDALVRRLGIIGSLPEVRERVRRLEELGVTHLGVTPPVAATSEAAWWELLAGLRDPSPPCPPLPLR
jgi:5,10-methylenetetrahydromethanopterin reductase